MGQYYKAICLNTKGFVEPWDYSNGAKLMEHSYIGNNFLEVVESLLSKNGKWYKKRIVWAGDYMEPYQFLSGTEINRLEKKLSKECIKLEGDYRYLTDRTTLYNYVSDVKRNGKESLENINPKDKILINHSLKKYIDLTPLWMRAQLEEGSLVIHPLSLLTCTSNQGGGGGYSGVNENLVGSWAGHIISLEKNIPEGFDKVDVEFEEAA